MELLSIFPLGNSYSGNSLSVTMRSTSLLSGISASESRTKSGLFIYARLSPVFLPGFSSALNRSVSSSSNAMVLFQPVDFDFPFQWFKFQVAGDEFSFLFLG
jgi:hypothetical protein